MGGRSKGERGEKKRRKERQDERVSDSSDKLVSDKERWSTFTCKKTVYWQKSGYAGNEKNVLTCTVVTWLL